MAENTVTEAALHLVQSFREANQAVAAGIVTSQERNVKFAQSIFTSGVEILKSHVEGTQALVQKIEQQTQKQQETFRRLVRELEQQSHQQQEAFQKLVQAAMEASKNLLYTPLSYYQQSIDATETISSI